MQDVTAASYGMVMRYNIKRELRRAARGMRFNFKIPHQNIATNFRIVLVGIYTTQVEWKMAKRRCKQIGETEYFVTNRAEICSRNKDRVLVRLKDFMVTETEQNLQAILLALREMNRS